MRTGAYGVRIFDDPNLAPTRRNAQVAAGQEREPAHFEHDLFRDRQRDDGIVVGFRFGRRSLARGGPGSSPDEYSDEDGAKEGGRHGAARKESVGGRSDE